jgi:hypothetical protein
VGQVDVQTTTAYPRQHLIVLKDPVLKDPVARAHVSDADQWSTLTLHGGLAQSGMLPVWHDVLISRCVPLSIRSRILSLPLLH